MSASPPTSSFFPTLNSQVLSHTDSIIKWESLTDVCFYREGSFTLTFLAHLHSRPVIVKLLKSDWQYIDEHASDLFSQEATLVLDNPASSTYLISMIARAEIPSPSAAPPFIVMEKLKEVRI